jgi:hypothetical protein
MTVKQLPDYILPACQNVGCRATAIGQMLLANGKTKQWRCLSHWRRGKPPSQVNQQQKGVTA